MQLISIETTPNPNSMKLNLDQSAGLTATYTAEDTSSCPDYIAQLLDIDGVQSVFVCGDFITMNRDPRAEWTSILDKATHILTGSSSGTTQDASADAQRARGETLGQAAVFVQTFRGIPIQVKVVDADGENRVALDTRFSDAAQLVQEKSGADYLKERYWKNLGVRYGARDQVSAEVVDEISGSLDATEIASLIADALGESQQQQRFKKSPDAITADLASDDWHKRLTAVQEIGTSEDAVSFLITALTDTQPQVRRLAAAALGASGSTRAVAPLAKALLEDNSVAVRRTAGDALSDLGDASAQLAMCEALSDSNKLVRWRAARFLFDLGTEQALPSLQQAVDDPEFEVRLEVQAAIERISGGKDTSMPAWKKILTTTEQP